MSLLRAFALSLPAVLLAACGAKQPPADDARVVRTTTVTTDTVAQATVSALLTVF